MFDDSDFEFDDEAIDAVLDSKSNVVPSKTVQKRPCEVENTCQEQRKTIYNDQVLQPSKKPKENNTVPNNFLNVTNTVYDQFCNIERTSVKSACGDNSGNSLTAFHNKPSSSSHLHRNITKKVVQRKFPGPAGLLPKNNATKTNDDDFYFKDMQNTQEPMLVSQRCELSFDDKLWKRVLEDFESEKLDNGYSLPAKYNIEWINEEAANNNLVNEKIPFLAAQIHSIDRKDVQSSVQTVTLKDRTGEIQATIEYDLYKEYTAELVVGSIIIIKQFGVSSRILVITVKNLCRIYHENISETKAIFHEELLENSVLVPEQIKITNVQDLSVKDIIKDIKRINDYKKRVEIIDDALGVFLDNFNKSFDSKKSSFTSKGSPVSSFNNNSLKNPPQSTSLLTKTCPKSPLEPKSNIAPQNSNTVDNLTAKKPKFNFKARSFNKENKISNTGEEKRIFNSQSCSQISVKADNVEEKKIVENIFEGLDADSLFGDF